MITYIYILQGVFLTLFITIICLFFGILIGFLTGICIFFKIEFISLISTYKNNKTKKFFPALYDFCNFYKKFFINTPILTQMFLVYFVLPLPLSPLMAGILVLSFNSGAHVTVIVLEALDNINTNQWNTAISLGLTPWVALRRIFFKSMVLNNRKLFFNEFINLLKESSVLSTFGVREICFRSKEIALQEYNFLPYMLFVSVVYFCTIGFFEKIYFKYINNI